MIKEELSKVIEMQEEFSNPYMVVYKPNNKKKLVEYDSDTCAFDIVEDKLLFGFWDYEDFSVKLKNIKSILFENFSQEMTIVHIGLKNSNEIMLHFMS